MTVCKHAFRVAVVAALAVAAGVSSARSADLPVKGGYKDEIVVEQAPVNWTGFYVGAGLGYESGRAAGALDVDVVEFGSFGANTDTSITGLVGTVTLGADWRFPSSRWLVGVYGDYTFGANDGELLGLSAGPEHVAISAKLENQWALGARIGVLVTPGTLLYGKLGYTQADESLEVSGLGSSGELWKKTAGGYEVGAGFESSIGSGFFLRGEYVYADFGSQTVAAADFGAASVSVTEDFSDNRFSAGIVYKLGLGR